MSAPTDFFRKKHIKFFERCLHILPDRYVSYDSYRMTIAFFALSGLDVLNAVEHVEKQQITRWIYSLQLAPEEGNKLEKCGFVGCTTNGTNSFLTSHIAMTYAALLSLLILDDDLGKVNKTAIMCNLRSLQLSSGSFCAVKGQSENDMRFVYCAATICAVLDDWRGMDVNLTEQYIVNSQTYEGGFGQGPGQEAHGGTTFCAVAALQLMGRLNTALTSERRSRLQRWCVMRQETGFQGRPNKPVDTCYSFWVGATLELLGIYHTINKEKNRDWLYEAQDSMVGGMAKWPDSTPDGLHSYFGLCGLSLNGDENVAALSPAFNITKRTAERLKSVHRTPGTGELPES